MAKPAPCGMFIRRRAENGFCKEYPTQHSYVSTQWLAFLESSQKIAIQHARNGSEFKVGEKNIPVDGYCRSVNLV